MEWTGARYADTPTVEVRRSIRASPHRVWELVTDIALMPRTSGELQSVEWRGGAEGPAVGASFVGRSKHDALGEWETVSYVIECAEPRVFAWAVSDLERPAAVWRFTIEEQPDGTTELTQWVQLGPGPSGLSTAIERMPDKEQKIVFVRLREFEHNMGLTLGALGELAEGTAR
ncbi:SRPBCC family protein [Streptomyces sp. NPDC001941]|uniref:SRPBCC family protein n=1 Tax=Streptomyces sp. NPDC001941 TaxID=3154659 RepID=UPI003328901F